MLYTECPERVRRAMTGLGLREVPIQFDFTGADIIARS